MLSCETKLWLMLLVFAATCTQHCVRGKLQVPCLFIFGDSSSDLGNNNYLSVTSRVDYPPYGVDFPKGVTGRYNNGKTTADIIGEILGFRDFIPAFADYQPPFANHHGSDIYYGMNCASAGGGIDDRTSTNLELHAYGARKFALSGVGFLDCSPYQISLHGTTGCVEAINDAVQLFNQGLPTLVDRLNVEYYDSKFMFVNYIAIQSCAFPDFITDESCCQIEQFFGACVYNGTYCKNRDKYAFWDGAHTSEAVNKIAAERSYNDPEGSFTYPTDIKTLVTSPCREGSKSVKEPEISASI